MLRTSVFLITAILSIAAAQAAQVRTPDPLQGDGRVSGFYSWQAVIPQPGQLLRQEELDRTLGLANAGAQFRILYSSTDGVDGKSPTVVSGLLFVPKDEPPQGGWPLMAWAHETAGMADICAPSWVGYSTRIEAFLNTWLARGMAVVATDTKGSVRRGHTRIWRSDPVHTVCLTASERCNSRFRQLERRFCSQATLRGQEPCSERRLFSRLTRLS